MRLGPIALLFLFFAPAFSSPAEGPAPGALPESRPIEDEAARALLQKALDYSRARLGPPESRVDRVELRLLVGEGARRGHPFTRAIDGERGSYAIYLTARPGEAAFAGQLTHEALHLRDTRLYDVYVEGLCSLLAADLLGELGMSWEPWLRHFESGKDLLYGESYRLLLDLREAAGREGVLRLLEFAAPSQGSKDRAEIDIDRWLESLDAAARPRARAAIERRFASLEEARARERPELAFRRPRK